jgi:hypothetical protein
VAQAQNEHLTTEQLSASFDKQLSPQEQAVFNAHISSCQQCQNRLTDLRLTTALLHSLPVEEVPRSFVIPDNVPILPDRTIQQNAPVTTLPQRQRPQRPILHRSVRIMSALAAVLALCFIISGMLPLIYHGAGYSASTASSGSTYAPVHTGVATPLARQPNNTLPSGGSVTTPSSTETASALSKKATATAQSSSDHSLKQGQSPTSPPIIDLSQPSVRLGVGVLVFAVSIIILIVTRRRRVAVH